MVCTLVGNYHQVVNTGQNFTVAINVELNYRPNDPIDYI